jgi:hypothetical protein
MAAILTMLFLLGFIPLVKAWLSYRQTAMVHTLNWTLIAWAAWVWLVSKPFDPENQHSAAWRYLALALTGCAMVAVLGARRPGAVAWNLVVLGLLAVELLPLAENLFFGSRLHLEWFRILLLAAVFAVGLVNYLPTRLGPAAIWLMLVLTCELLDFPGQEKIESLNARILFASRIGLALVPWCGFLLLTCNRSPRTEFDRVWRAFRDSFGLVWAQRVREQFNRSAHHAGWPVTLSWSGLRRSTGSGTNFFPNQLEMLENLLALLKRFGPAEGITKSDQ